MSNANKEIIERIARETNTRPIDITLKYCLTPRNRRDIVKKLSLEDDEEYDDDIIDQMCDTPTSRQRLYSFFVKS